MKLRCAILLSAAALVLSGTALTAPAAKAADAGNRAAANKAVGEMVGRIADETRQFAQVAAATAVVAPAPNPPGAPVDKSLSAPAKSSTAKPEKAAAAAKRPAAKHDTKTKLAATSGEKILEPARAGARHGRAVAEPKPMTVRCVGRTETGKAAWYGGRYIGRQTSSGERLDTIHATAAHRTLPLNSLARVTNLANGRSVIVRVTDRGPISESLLIDMSPRAAEELAMKQAGIVPVKVEQVVEVASDAK
jgi:rare lipoprotein A